MRLTAEDLDAVDHADVVAANARKRWLARALHPDRKGKQIPPTNVDWELLLWMAGRGFGKTESLSQWLWWECWRVPGIIGHWVAPTLSDIRGTAFEGPVGLLNVIPSECLRGGSRTTAYIKQDREIHLANGSFIRGFSAVEEAGRLRGPQCHCMAGDELREWDRPAGNLEDAMNNALFGLRLQYPDGTPSRAVFATTPKTIPFLKRFEKRDKLVVVRGTSRENLRNLSSSYRNQILSLEGTLIGKQEIDAAYIDEESDISIIKRKWINLWPHDKKLPNFSFILEAYDTAASEENFDVKRQTTDPTASIVLGLFNVAQCFDEKERRRMGIRSKYAALLLEAWSERLGFPDLLDRARTQRRIKWGTPGRRSDMVLIEDKSSGRQLRQTLATFGVPCWPYKPMIDKAMRLNGVSPEIRQGMLFVPESARPDRKGMPRAWCEEFLEQVCAYAGIGSVVHDDYVDTLSSGFIYLKDQGMLEATPDEPFLDAEDKKEKERADAEMEYEKQKRRKAGNPYG